MTVIDKVLNELKSEEHEYVSGQSMAEKLSVSRAAIWKAVNSLKEQGYEIEAVTNRGYRLNKEVDLLSEAIIRSNLNSQLKDIEINIFKSIDSTNNEAKRRIIQGELKDWTIFLSEEQVKGRGRQGKSFLSPANKGIYLSIVVVPSGNNSAQNKELITVKAALSVAVAIENLTEKMPKIKWVNDIFLNNKKICGILTEAESDFESGDIKALIIGIGLNVSTREADFTKDLMNIAGALNPVEIKRNRIVAEILNCLYNIVENMESSEVIKEYKKRSNVLGREIEFTINSKDYIAKAIDINESGNLIVENKNEYMILSSGEISIRGDWSLE